MRAAGDWRGWLDELAAHEARARLATPRARELWIAAERLPQFRALWPRLATEPAHRRAGRL